MRALLLLVALLLPLCAYAEDNKSAISTLTVHAEAVTKIAPDQVTLPVTVVEENASLKLAKSRHDEKLRALLKLAQDTAIAKEKIQTNYTAVSPQYDYDKNGSHPHLRGYRVETSLDFKLTDMNKLGDFMNGVIALDISNIGSVSYSLQDEDKVKEDTLNTALEHAYAKALRLAATAHVAIDRPLSIEEGSSQYNPPRPMMRMNAMAMSGGNQAPPELPEGLIEIRQSVTVTYALK